MAAWDDLPISDRDRALFAKGGMGGRLTPGERPAVLVVDMNNAFVDDRYPMANEETGRPAARAIARLLEAARRQGVPVFYTTGLITDSQAVRGIWKGDYGQVDHPLLSRPESNEITREIPPQPGDVVIQKAKPSAFWGTGLIDMLIYHKVDTVIVTGMTTSGCVRATVVDAFSHNLRVLVPEECSADRGELSHKVSLFDMHMKYADVLPLDEVLGYLDSVATKQAATV